MPAIIHSCYRLPLLPHNMYHLQCCWCAATPLLLLQLVLLLLLSQHQSCEVSWALEVFFIFGGFVGFGHL